MVGTGYQRGGRVQGDGARELTELCRRELGGVGARVTPLAQVQVVGHLGDQVSGVLDEHSVAVVVGRGAELVQHRVAERVRRRDGRAVEVGQCAVQAVTSITGCLGVPVGDEALTDPGAQLAGGLPAEADDEQLVHLHRIPGDALGDVAGHEPGDRVGLARPGARLEHARAGGQGTFQVEGRRSGDRHGRTRSPRLRAASASR